MPKCEVCGYYTAHAEVKGVKCCMDQSCLAVLLEDELMSGDLFEEAGQDE